ncbi:hypothetical protein B0H13DRAFT_2341655 [Mycena leptocephala]|nr:hypothetical protein B0H13DRAFT_2341655 [Mycena leptocephala]
MRNTEVVDKMMLHKIRALSDPSNDNVNGFLDQKYCSVYVKEDIEFLGDAKYLVRSKSNPFKIYEVDIHAYTCNCLDYLLICYCKHICAVQALFDDQDSPSDDAQAQPDSPNVPAFSALPPSVPSEAPAQNRKSNIITVVAEKLERLGARLCARRRNTPNLSDRLKDLEAAVDAMLLETDGDSVLPSTQRLPPARQSMLPDVKTRKTPVGDPSYGGGASSGSKAKKAKKTPTPLPDIPSRQTTIPPLLQYPPLLMYPTAPPQYVLPHYPQPPHPYAQYFPSVPPSRS